LFPKFSTPPHQHSIFTHSINRNLTCNCNLCMEVHMSIPEILRIIKRKNENENILMLKYNLDWNQDAIENEWLFVVFCPFSQSWSFSHLFEMYFSKWQVYLDKINAWFDNRLKESEIDVFWKKQTMS